MYWFECVIVWAFGCVCALVWDFYQPEDERSETKKAYSLNRWLKNISMSVCINVKYIIVSTVQVFEY